ncbi:MAG: phosphoglucosamine mutase [Bacteroidetes bacterium]|nr:phosphoglucosamine mutase [Bacteroidota bacterium]
MSLMVSISGIRGIIGQSLTPEVIIRYVNAYARYSKKGAIVIGRDGRITGHSIAQIVAGTLRQAGSDVIDLGICPTPTVALAVKHLKSAGGISITASHNPMVWNGLKFFAPSGLFLDAHENEAVWSLADGPGVYAPWNAQGGYSLHEDFIEHHIHTVLSLPYIDHQELKKRKFKIVVDAVNAAGGMCVPKLLELLGCEIIRLNCDVTGVFARIPEPLPENLTHLCEVVRSSNADLGIAVDPDVDRLVLIMENGEPFGEEYTIAAASRFILEKKRGLKNLTVVVNLSTTRAIDDIAKEYGATVLRTPVGEINVAKKMKETQAVIGGEGSGGVILPDVHYGRDALVGIALILQYLLEFGQPLSTLKASLPTYSITKHKIELGRLNADTVLQRVIDCYRKRGTLSTDDGVKIDFECSWLHLRKSNTEPIIRIIAEAPTATEAIALVQECETIIRS